MKYVANISEEYIDQDNIKWLVIEPHVHDNIIVGYYMFLHEDINEPCKWDNWYPTLAAAFNAGEDYGLEKENWEVLNDD